jgi:hypothetical protein
MRHSWIPALCLVITLASCAWPVASDMHLADEGYSIKALSADEVAVRVHVNQLKELGGEVTTAEFRNFVAERLKRHGMCPSGWAPLPCVEDGSCLQRTTRSVTIPGRCTQS